MMSNFQISKLENFFVQELNKQLSQVPPFSINKRLYETACNHAKDILSKKIKNVKAGLKERKARFPAAKRYREICFVSSPISSHDNDEETSKQLCSMIMRHYQTELNSGLNSVGPALIPLKSNKILVIILFAFFQPFVTVSKFDAEFEPLSKQKALPDDENSFVELCNRFRILANFDKLNRTPRKQKPTSFCFARYHFRCTVSYSIQLFQRLMSDCKLYDILVDYWTNFTIDTTHNPNDKSQVLLSMTFWRFDSYLDYKVDILVIPPKDRKNEAITSKQEKPSNEISFKPEDIVIREREVPEDITNNLTKSELVKTRLNQEINDLSNQAKRDAQGAIEAAAQRDNFARLESEAHEEAKEARKLQEQYEEQASESLAIAHEAENSINKTIKKQQDAEQNEEEPIIREVEISNIPEYSHVAEKAFEQASMYENAAEKEAEIAKKAEAAEKEARKKKEAADLVSAALQRSYDYLESKAEAVEYAEEVFDAEASKEFDFGVDKTQYINDSETELLDHDVITDREIFSVFDKNASNENGLAKDGSLCLDFDSKEAMEMLKAEKENDPSNQNDTIIEEEEIVEYDDNNNVIVKENQPVYYMFEARNGEVDPVIDHENAKETELAGNSEVPEHIQSEAAKELKESA